MLIIAKKKWGIKLEMLNLKKVPYTVVIGDDEVNDNTLSVRKHGENSEQKFEVYNFIEKVIEEKDIL